jgi:hypothetical protein
MKKANAICYTFKASGKYYTFGRGYSRPGYYGGNRRERLIDDNDGKCPGLGTDGREFFILVIPDDESAPYLLKPEELP